MKNTVMLIIALVLVGALAFAIGLHFPRRFVDFGKNYGAQFAPPMAGMPHQRWGVKDELNRGFIQGQISKIEDNKIALQLPNGGTYTLTLDEQTTIEKTTKVAKEDLSTGQNITVYNGRPFLGTVQRIVINP